MVKLGTTLIAATLVGATASPAFADHGGHGGFHGGFHHGFHDHDGFRDRFHNRFFFGFGGFGFFDPFWPVAGYPYYPYGYAAYGYPYGYPYPAYPPAAAPAAATPTAWYFCPASKSYYPYVQSCAVTWQQVPSQPPQ